MNAPTGPFAVDPAAGKSLNDLPVATALADADRFYLLKDTNNDQAATIALLRTTIGLPAGPVPPAQGGTGLTTYAVGDLVYASAATTLSRLADVAVGNVLLSGGVAGAPTYGKVGLTSHVSGTLPVANGGTNLTAFTANGIVFASSAGVLATGAALTFDGTNLATTGKAIAKAHVANNVPSTDWGIDFGPSTGNANFISIANNGTYDLAPGSGMVCLAENGGGGAAQIFVIYGAAFIVWQNAANYTNTAGTAGKINVFFNSTAYRIQNLSGATINLFIGMIRMRTNL